MNYCTAEEIELEREIRKNKLFKNKNRQDAWSLLFLLIICMAGLLLKE